MPVVVDKSHQCCPDLSLGVAAVNVALKELVESSLLWCGVSPLAEPEEVKIGLAELVLLDDDLLQDVFEIDELLAETDEIVYFYVVYTGARFGSAVDHRDGGVVETSEDAEVRAWVQEVEMEIPVEEGNVDFDNSLDDEVQPMHVITSFYDLGANIKLQTFHHKHNFKNKIIFKSRKVRYILYAQLFEFKIYILVLGLDVTFELEHQIWKDISEFFQGFAGEGTDC